MKFYHGSKGIIERPIFKGSEATNDYGPAFYLTVDLDAAKAWACKNNVIGIVNEYELSKHCYEHFKILDLTDKNKYNVLHWLAILMRFRQLDERFIHMNNITLDWLKQYYVNVDDFDIIIGYRADDAYFRFPIKFISGDLAIEDLENAFKLGNLGVQYAFISQKAISHLKFVKAIQPDMAYLNRYFLTVQEATTSFREILDQPKDPQKHYILELIRGTYEYR